MADSSATIVELPAKAVLTGMVAGKYYIFGVDVGNSGTYAPELIEVTPNSMFAFGAAGEVLVRPSADVATVAQLNAAIAANPGGLDQTAVDARVVAGITGKADAGHNHDSIYAEISHAHAIAGITGLQAALDAKQSSGNYAAATHSHAQSEVANLVNDLAGKSATGHNHTGVYQPLAAALTNTTASFTTALESKLGGIATAATANATDAQLRDRSTHTGTQTLATISDAGTAASHAHAEYATAAQGALASTALQPAGSAALLTSFPTLNQSTTGSAATLTTPRTINGVSFDGGANITVAAAAGTLTGAALPSTIVSAPGLLTSALDTGQSVAPTTGQTQTFGIAKKNELLALTHSATIAAQTLVFPSDTNSQLWQILRVYSRNIVTVVTLTLNGNTIYGTALTTLALNGNAAWQKIGASIWVRIQ